MNDVDLKIVSAHLGHSDINITADTYTDVLHARQNFVADLVDLNLEDENDKLYALLRSKSRIKRYFAKKTSIKSRFFCEIAFYT